MLCAVKPYLGYLSHPRSLPYHHHRHSSSLCPLSTSRSSLRPVTPPTFVPAKPRRSDGWEPELERGSCSRDQAVRMSPIDCMLPSAWVSSSVLPPTARSGNYPFQLLQREPAPLSPPSSSLGRCLAITRSTPLSYKNVVDFWFDLNGCLFPW